MRLPVASLAEAKQFEDDSLSAPGQNVHAGLQLLVAPLEGSVQRPQVLDGRHIQEVVLGQPCVERLEFICNTIYLKKKKKKGIRKREYIQISNFGYNLLLRLQKLVQIVQCDVSCLVLVSCPAVAMETNPFAVKRLNECGFRVTVLKLDLVSLLIK